MSCLYTKPSKAWSPDVEPDSVKQNSWTESSRTWRPWHFGSGLPRHLRSQQVTCYLGPLSSAWLYMTWQVRRAPGDVRHAQMLLLFVCYCKGRFRRPLRSSWNLAEIHLCTDLGRQKKISWLPSFLSGRLKIIPSIICCSKSLKRSVKKLRARMVHFLVPVYVGVFVSVVRQRWRKNDEYRNETSEMHSVLWPGEAQSFREFWHIFKHFLFVWRPPFCMFYFWMFLK